MHVRNLDFSNPAVFKPSRFAAMAAALPFLLALICLPLASSVAPAIAFSENPITIALFVILAVSAVMMVLPLIFKWGWQTKYFGVLLLYVGSVGLIGFVPCLCVAFYGKTGWGVKISPLILYLVFHYVWCRRFTAIYGSATSVAKLRGLIYQEEEDAVYYMRRGDSLLLERELKFIQIPPNRYFFISVLTAFLLISVNAEARATFGVPFFHVFLMVSMLPVSLACVGLAFRGLLIFYFYPLKIEKTTGKRVYVDMSGKSEFGR